MTQDLNLYTMQTLFEQPLEPIDFLVDGLFAQGLYILGGSPKVGKSWLALQLCLAVCTGTPFLGRKTQQGEVLYLALEDGPQRLHSRALRLTQTAPVSYTHLDVYKRQGKNSLLREAVRREMNALQSRWNCSIVEIYAAGMITSDTGLCEVKHIAAPANLPQLAANAQVRVLPEISNVPFCFVPGIRFESDDPNDADMLRGEEVEVFGAMDSEDEEKQLFVHFGSHNKIICVENGSITRAATTLSGELLWAVCNHTILKSSVTLPGSNGCEMDAPNVQQGFRAAEQYGLSRALFCARVRQKTDGITPVSYTHLCCSPPRYSPKSG